MIGRFQYLQFAFLVITVPNTGQKLIEKQGWQSDDLKFMTLIYLNVYFVTTRFKQ